MKPEVKLKLQNITLLVAMALVFGLLYNFKIKQLNNNMEHLETIGVFFEGLGLLLSSFGIFWFVSVYQKTHQSKHGK